jgi:hypothetical protein
MLNAFTMTTEFKTSCIKPLKTGCTLFYIRTHCVPRSKHSPPQLHKTNLFMLYKPKVAVCSEIRTKHTKAMRATFSIFEC